MSIAFATPPNAVTPSLRARAVQRRLTAPLHGAGVAIHLYARTSVPLKRERKRGLGAPFLLPLHVAGDARQHLR
jgi:hypothetical protein